MAVLRVGTANMKINLTYKRSVTEIFYEIEQLRSLQHTHPTQCSKFQKFVSLERIVSDDTWHFTSLKSRGFKNILILYYSKHFVL